MTSKRLTDRARFHGISRSLAADGSTKLDAVLYRRDAETLASRKRIKLVFPRMFPAQVERSWEESSAKSRLSNQINRRLCLTVDRGFEIESNLSLPLSWWIVMPTPRLVSRHIRRIDLIRQSSPANGWRGNWLNHPNPWRIGDAAQYSIETRSRSRAETCSNQPKQGLRRSVFIGRFLGAIGTHVYSIWTIGWHNASSILLYSVDVSASLFSRSFRGQGRSRYKTLCSLIR